MHSFFLSFCSEYPSLYLKSPLSSRLVSSEKALVIHQMELHVSSWRLLMSLIALLTLYGDCITCPVSSRLWETIVPFSLYISRASRLPGTWQSINVVCVCVFLRRKEEKRRRKYADITYWWYRHHILMMQTSCTDDAGIVYWWCRHCMLMIQTSHTDDAHFVLLNSDCASWLSRLNQLLCFVLLYKFLKGKALWSLQAR